MAVAIIMEFTGATLAQYDETVKRMGLTPGGPGPSGAISHWQSLQKTDCSSRMSGSPASSTTPSPRNRSARSRPR